MDSCDTLKNILSANQLYSLIDVKRKFINSDNHKFHKYQENDYLSGSAPDNIVSHAIVGTAIHITCH
jgi:uncharacterized protein (UPF0276 family)